MNKRQTVLQGIGIGIGIALIILAVFGAGFVFGTRHKLPFMDRRGMFWPGFVHNRFGHGVFGTIDSLGSNTFIVRDPSGGLKTVLVVNETLFRSDSSSIKFSDLRKNDRVIVLGEPEEKEGAVKAKVVRVISTNEASRSGNLWFH